MPTSFLRSLLAIMVKPTPIRASTGEKEVGSSKRIKKLSPVQAGQAQNPGGHCGAHVGTHNHANGLTQGK